MSEHFSGKDGSAPLEKLARTPTCRSTSAGGAGQTGRAARSVWRNYNYRYMIHGMWRWEGQGVVSVRALRHDQWWSQRQRTKAINYNASYNEYSLFLSGTYWTLLRAAVSSAVAVLVSSHAHGTAQPINIPFIKLLVLLYPSLQSLSIRSRPLKSS